MSKSAVYNRPIPDSARMRYAASVGEVGALSRLLGIGVGELLGEPYNWLVETMVRLLSQSTNDDAIDDLVRFSRLLVCDLSDDRVQAIRDETDYVGLVSVDHVPAPSPY